MAPSPLLKAVLLYLASTSAILPYASAAPIPDRSNDGSPSLDLDQLDPKADSIVDLQTACARFLTEKSSSSIRARAHLSNLVARSRVTFRADLDTTDGDETFSTRPRVVDPTHPEWEIVGSPDDGGFGPQPQPYETPYIHRIESRTLRDVCEYSYDRSTCSRRAHHRHSIPLAWARQFLRKVDYHSRDFQQLIHKIWLSVTSMPEKFAVAGAVAVLVVVSILVAAEKVGQANERRKRKQEEWRAASRRGAAGIQTGKRHLPAPISQSRARSNGVSRTYKCLQRKATLLIEHFAKRKTSA